MRPVDRNRLREAAEVAARFALRGPPGAVEPLGKGLINDTFLVAAGSRRWVLQRINGRVFPQPRTIMENLARLSARLSRRPIVGLRVPGLVRAADGAPWVLGKDGGLWRLMEFIPGGRVLTDIENSGQAAEVGRALGTFHRYLAGIAPGELRVTLPGFHVAPGYVSRLMRVLQTRHVALESGRVSAAAAFVNERRATAGTLEQARRDGQIRQRLIHGDPKLDNILFDDSGLRALALIDLDTVQPGLLHYDIGDCLRSCCSRDGGSEGHGDRVSFDIGVCAALLDAYAEHTGGLLRRSEVDLLYDAARIIPLELGVRFLTDHLEGDRWFRVAKPGDNLARAETQFALVADIEEKADAIRGVIGDAFRCCPAHA